jgi:hypothetical protein
MPFQSSQTASSPDLAQPKRGEFTFVPLVHVTDEEEYEVGDLEHVATSIQASIRSTIDELGARQAQGKRPACPAAQLQGCCAWMWITESGYRTRWTVEGMEISSLYESVSLTMAL